MGTRNLIKSMNTDSFVIRKVQPYDYLYVLDFEATCWHATDPNNKLPHEIIEFSLVLFDIAKNSVIAEFQQYVQPTERPVLSEFCTELTGITQNQVAQGVTIIQCLDLFKPWFMSTVQRFNIVVSSDPFSRTNLKKGVFVTWSNWDLGVCLPRECNRKRIIMPEIFRCKVDLRALYINHYQTRPKGLDGALNSLGMLFVGKQHSGLSDARNTAYLAGKMIKDGCKIA